MDKFEFNISYKADKATLVKGEAANRPIFLARGYLRYGYLTVENIRFLAYQDSKKVYVAVPEYKTLKKQDGSEEKVTEYRPLVHPNSAEAREAWNAAIAEFITAEGLDALAESYDPATAEA